jgi:prepilin-type N-terminal cleavage/methylation domain-containing protein
MAEFGDEKGLSLLEVMVAMFMVALISSSLIFEKLLVDTRAINGKS